MCYISLLQKPHRTSAYWKLDNNILKVPEFIRGTRQLLSGFIKLKCKTFSKYELLKFKIKKLATSCKQRHDRKYNVVIYGLTCQDKKDTLHKVQDIFNIIEVPLSEIRDVRPLPLANSQGSSTLVKVCLVSLNFCNQLLSKSRDLRKRNDALKAVYVNPDLTYEERQRNKFLRDKLKELKQTHPDAYINANTIVKKGLGIGEYVELWKCHDTAHTFKGQDSFHATAHVNSTPNIRPLTHRRSASRIPTPVRIPSPARTPTPAGFSKSVACRKKSQLNPPLNSKHKSVKPIT
jgi:hypothetical protein